MATMNWHTFTSYFQPDPSVLNEIGMKELEPFSILRFVARKTSHTLVKRDCL